MRAHQSARGAAMRLRLRLRNRYDAAVVSQCKGQATALTKKLLGYWSCADWPETSGTVRSVRRKRHPIEHSVRNLVCGSGVLRLGAAAPEVLKSSSALTIHGLSCSDMPDSK